MRIFSTLVLILTAMGGWIAFANDTRGPAPQIAFSQGQTLPEAPEQGKVQDGPLKRVIVEGEYSSIRPCLTEDSPIVEGTPCYWNAQERGNGKGRSFVLMPAETPGDDGRVVFLD